MSIASKHVAVESYSLQVSLVIYFHVLGSHNHFKAQIKSIKLTTTEPTPFATLVIIQVLNRMIVKHDLYPKTHGLRTFPRKAYTTANQHHHRARQTFPSSIVLLCCVGDPHFPRKGQTMFCLQKVNTSILQLKPWSQQ